MTVTFTQLEPGSTYFRAQTQLKQRAGIGRSRQFQYPLRAAHLPEHNPIR